jgi:hypothetical protein
LVEKPTGFLIPKRIKCIPLRNLERDRHRHRHRMEVNIKNLRMLKKQEVRMWAGLIWLRIENSVGLLRKW